MASDPRRRRGFRIRLWLARLVVSFEAVWPALWPTLAVLGLFVIVSLFGLWLSLPLALHAILLAAFVAALGLALWQARASFRLAAERAGLARLERDSAAAHQPLQSLGDTLPPSMSEATTRRLWELHRARLIARLREVRLKAPRSALPRRDPWALRAALVLALVVAFVHGRGEIGPRLVSAFTVTPPVLPAAAAPKTELWITPPAYTRRPPLGAGQTSTRPELAVPVGSEALVQLHHLPVSEAPFKVVQGGREVPAAGLGGASAEARLKLEADGWLAVVSPGGDELAGWLIKAIPDAPPVVAFAEPPRATHRSVLRVGYEAKDDYGIAEIVLRLAPADRRDETERLPIAKPGGQPPQIKSGSYLDLTAHPLAGLPVVLRLEATDGRGQQGMSEPLELVLPAREFRHPLARAIIEERRKVAARREADEDVAGRLTALAETRIAQELPTAVPLALRVAAARLASSGSEPTARRSVIDILWETALFIEDGALSLAERRLRELQERLQQALSEDTPDAELERLMQELQQALNEFLEEMTRQAMEQAQRMDPGELQQPIDPSRLVEQRDLQEMLDRAREMMRNGSKEAAREMLAQLQEMLENLRSGMAQSQPSPGEQALSDLQKMIQLQQQLQKQSFDMERRMRNGEMQRPGRQQGQQQGQQGQQPGQDGNQMGQAAGQQEALRRALGELMRRLGEQGMEIPRAMGQAELEMRNARGALEEGAPGSAAEAQSQAVDAMQRAGQAMMEQMQEQMADQAGPGQGQEPLPQGRRGRDPFGRATHNDGGIDTQGVEVPDEGALGRARDVLQELYRRAGDRRRPPAELDYFRRLLDRF